MGSGSRRTVLVAGLSVMSGASALAQPAPFAGGRPVQLFVPYPPGGFSDAVARLVAQGLGTELGTQVVVINKPGAASSVAARELLSQPRDGRSLLLATSFFILNPFFQSQLGFSVENDFRMLSLLVEVPQVLIASPSMPSDWPSFLQRWRDDPTQLRLATFGPGSEPEVAATRLARTIGVRAELIPYKGGGPAMLAVASGEVGAALVTLPGAASLLASGRVKALAVTSAERQKLLPGVPTFRELGVAYNQLVYVGLAVARGTPEPLVQALHRAVQAAMRQPVIGNQVESQGATVRTLGPDDYDALLRRERRAMGEILGRVAR